MATQITDPVLLSVLTEVILPAADQWAASTNVAKRLHLIAEARGISAAVQAAIEQSGADAYIDLGNRKVTLSDMEMALRVGEVVRLFAETADARFAIEKDEKGSPIARKPELAIFNIAGAVR